MSQRDGWIKEREDEERGEPMAPAVSKPPQQSLSTVHASQKLCYVRAGVYDDLRSAVVVVVVKNVKTQ